jgi:hypothetical protein
MACGVPEGDLLIPASAGMSFSGTILAAITGYPGLVLPEEPQILGKGSMG